MNQNVFYLDNASFFAFFYKILYPIEWLMTHLLVIFHKALTFLGFKDGPGAAWWMSIVLLVIFVHLCILPIFVRQMKSMQKMQALQPKLQHIQAKYKGKNDPASREAQQRETMKLYQDMGANPAGSCLPLLIQSPIFMTMFYVLSSVSYVARGVKAPYGAFTVEVAKDFEATHVFNVSLASMFSTSGSSARITIGVFIALMCGLMFLQQYYNLRRNLPRESMHGQQYNMQRSMMFIFPLMYIFSGATFPFGVLVYWLTNNVCNLIRTIWQVEHMPTPGSPAAETRARRVRKREEERRKRKGLPSVEEEALAKAKAAEAERAEKGHQRQQPNRRKNKSRKKR
ncbi:membrane protein insertase YidC [Bifidobacterium sp. 82T24]|uniref:membrane protein insertase YidC n=1 Tax=Bifidobacterium pluvialisilvae TaxID=2834436 RepID=UPI001C5880C1|nr:membrane protein insertase YidC [Bifidobacterium pluvialisilvae]MBW3088669.1 membrane protein insertase YidC [Bifidobacterium pluvialisilvae]